MMNVSLHHRGVDTQLRAVFQSKIDRSLNHRVIDDFERLRRQPIEAAVERIVLGYPITVEVSKLTQHQSVGDPFAQLAIVPVLDAHENQRAQDLLRRQSTATAPRLLQTSHQIAPDPLDHLLLVVKEVGNDLQQRLQTHALPHQFKIGKADLSRHRSRHFSALLALRRVRPLALQCLDIARSGFLQQLLQGAPIVHTATQLGNKLLGNVDRKTPSVQPTVQNVTLMLFARQTGWAVLAYTRTASQAERAQNGRPKARRFTLQPAHDIGG